MNGAAVVGLVVVGSAAEGGWIGCLRTGPRFASMVMSRCWRLLERVAGVVELVIFGCGTGGIATLRSGAAAGGKGWSFAIRGKLGK